MKQFNQRDKPDSNHLKINFSFIKKNLVTMTIIGLISVVGSLALGSVARKVPVSQLKTDLPIALLDNCSDRLFQVSQSDSLKQADIFSPNLVSAITLRREFVTIFQCADYLKYNSSDWREASYILNNLPSYEPVSNSLKRTLRDALDDFKSQLDDYLLNSYMSQLLQGEKGYVVNFCIVFLLLNLIYFGMSDLDIDLDIDEQNSEHNG